MVSPKYQAWSIVMLQVAIGVLEAYDLHYLGCFEDVVGARDLPVIVYSSNNNSPIVCMAACLARKYRYSGVQYSVECFCGNSYGRHGGVSDSECNRVCPGDNKFKCGSNSRNSLYRVDAAPLQYMGCYVDKSSRDMPHESLYGQSQMSPSSCMDHCQSKGYTFAAVQYRDHCFCGNHYGRYGKGTETQCLYQCKGKTHLFCGGSWRNAVYRIDPKFDKFKGCYKDNSTHDLWAHSFALNGSVSSPRTCVARCASKSFPFAAVHNLTTCYCGFSYGKYGEADSYRECNNFCDPSSQGCSDDLRNAVYDTDASLSTPSKTVFYSPSKGQKALFGHVIGTESSVTSVTTCINYCELVDSCQSINYDESAQVCELNSAIVGEGSRLESRDRLTYYAPVRVAMIVSFD